MLLFCPRTYDNACCCYTLSRMLCPTPSRVWWSTLKGSWHRPCRGSRSIPKAAWSRRQHRPGGIIPKVASSRRRQQHPGGSCSIRPAVLTSAGASPRRDTFPFLLMFRSSFTIIKQRCSSFRNQLGFFGSIWSTMRGSDELSFCCCRALRGRSTSSSSTLRSSSLCSSVIESKQTPCSPSPPKILSHFLCDTSKQRNRTWILLWARPSLLMLMFIPIQNMLFYSMFESYACCVVFWSFGVDCCAMTVSRLFQLLQHNSSYS